MVRFGFVSVFCNQLNEGCFFKQGGVQDLRHSVGAGIELQSFPDGCAQDMDRDADPDLGLDGVVGGAMEGLDSEMLPDPFEEQFDLPSVLVPPGDGQGRQVGVVGDEDQGSCRARGQRT